MTNSIGELSSNEIRSEIKNLSIKDVILTVSCDRKYLEEAERFCREIGECPHADLNSISINDVISCLFKNEVWLQASYLAARKKWG